MTASWIVAGRVAAMGMPWPEDIAALADDGFAGVVSLTSRLPEGLPHPTLAHLHLPIRDFHPPTQEQLEQAVAFIRERLASGPVAVHCGAGLGRTGTVVAAWLVSEGHAPDAAIRAVRRRRPGSVETAEQERAIEEFARRRGGEEGR